MTNLTTFKNKLSELVNHPTLRMKTIIRDQMGQIVRTNEAAPVGGVNINGFYLWRGDRQSWAKFGKRAEWVFTPISATQTMGKSSTITFEIVSTDQPGTPAITL